MFTPSRLVKNFDGDTSPGERRDHAEVIVKHQRERKTSSSISAAATRNAAKGSCHCRRPAAR